MSCRAANDEPFGQISLDDRHCRRIVSLLLEIVGEVLFVGWLLYLECLLGELQVR